MPTAPRLRPLVELTVAQPPAEVLDRVRHALASAACPCQGRTARAHIDLQICEQERHTWSPTLTLEVEAAQDGGAVLFGSFGPHPNVWTFFVWLRACCAVVLIVGTMGGIAQQQAGQSPWAYAGTALGLAGFLGVFQAARVGQSLGADQMHVLLDFLKRSIDTDATAP